MKEFMQMIEREDDTFETLSAMVVGALVGAFTAACLTGGIF